MCATGKWWTHKGHDFDSGSKNTEKKNDKNRKCVFILTPVCSFLTVKNTNLDFVLRRRPDASLLSNSINQSHTSSRRQNKQLKLQTQPDASSSQRWQWQLQWWYLGRNFIHFSKRGRKTHGETEDWEATVWSPSFTDDVPRHCCLPK